MRTPWITIIWALLLVLPTRALAQLVELNGSLDVSAVQAEIDGNDQETLQQRYTVNASRRLTDAIRTRASLRYFKFDIDGAEQLGVFREEIQPTGELTWQHGLFNANVNGSRRSVRSQATTGRLITDTFVADLRTVPTTWPIFALRYDWQRVEDDGAMATRDALDRRFLARVNWDRDHEQFEYRFTRRWSSNRIRDLDTREISNQLRYLGSHALDDEQNLRLDTQYLFTRRDQTSEVVGSGRLLERVGITQTLFAVDPSPELDTLVPVPGLSDGITTVGTIPSVEIGAGSIDRNIGADLGIERDAIAAVYVYVDRISSPTVNWRVFVSEDGIDWQLAVSSPIRAFDAAQLRYEIEFDPLAARYVKVVNGGTNDVADVVVTEVEVYEVLRDVDEVERQTTTHLANATLRWRATDRVEWAVDGSVRLEPQQGTVGDREGYDYAVRSRWQQTDDLQWSGRWEQSWQRFPDSGPSLRDDVLSATGLYDPLPTLGSSLSASYRRSIEGGRELRNIRSGFASIDATPISTVDLIFDGVVSRIENPLENTTNDVWSLRGSADTEITRSLRLLGSWAHQETTTRPGDDLVIRDTWTLDVDLQITERIFARAGATWVEDERYSRRQDYLLNWRVGPRLVLTGQMILDEGSDGFRSDRTSLNATFDINSRTTAYLRYSEIEQGTGDEERTLSWQQGLRMVF